MPNAVANRSRCKFPAPVRGGVHLALADVGADVEESQLARHNATHASTGKGVDDNCRRGALLRPRRVPRQRAFSKDGVKNACASKAERQCPSLLCVPFVAARCATPARSAFEAHVRDFEAVAARFRDSSRESTILAAVFEAL